MGQRGWRHGELVWETVEKKNKKSKRMSMKKYTGVSTQFEEQSRQIQNIKLMAAHYSAFWKQINQRTKKKQP